MSSDDADASESLPDPGPFTRRNHSGFLRPPTPPSPPRSTTPSRRHHHQADFVAAAAEAGLQRRLFEQEKVARNGNGNGSGSMSVLSLGSSAPNSFDDNNGVYPSHLPSIEQSRLNGVTALPNSFVQRDLEFSVMKLVSEQVSPHFLFAECSHVDSIVGRSFRSS